PQHDLKSGEQYDRKRRALVRTDRLKLFYQLLLQTYPNRLATPGADRWSGPIGRKLDYGWGALQLCSPEVDGAAGVVIDQFSLPSGVVRVLNRRRRVGPRAFVN